MKLTPAEWKVAGALSTGEDLTRHISMRCAVLVTSERFRGSEKAQEKAHADGRKQYPILLVLYLPASVPTHLKVLYTRPVASLAEACKVKGHYTLTDADDLTSDWLESSSAVRPLEASESCGPPRLPARRQRERKRTYI